MLLIFQIFFIIHFFQGVVGRVFQTSLYPKTRGMKNVLKPCLTNTP